MEEEKLKEDDQGNCDHLSEESDNEALYSNQKTETKVRSVIFNENLMLDRNAALQWVKKML